MVRAFPQIDTVARLLSKKKKLDNRSAGVEEKRACPPHFLTCLRQQRKTRECRLWWGFSLSLCLSFSPLFRNIPSFPGRKREQPLYYRLLLFFDDRTAAAAEERENPPPFFSVRPFFFFGTKRPHALSYSLTDLLFPNSLYIVVVVVVSVWSLE